MPKAKRMRTIRNTTWTVHEYLRARTEWLCEAVPGTGIYRCSLDRRPGSAFCTRHQQMHDRLALVPVHPEVPGEPQ